MRALSDNIEVMKLRLSAIVVFLAVLAVLAAPFSVAFAASHGKPPCHQSTGSDTKAFKACCAVACCAAVIPVFDSLFEGMGVETVMITAVRDIEGAVLPPLLGPPRL